MDKADSSYPPGPPRHCTKTDQHGEGWKEKQGASRGAVREPSLQRMFQLSPEGGRAGLEDGKRRELQAEGAISAKALSWKSIWNF